MPNAPQTLNGLRAISVRLSIPWRGVWVAFVEIDADLPDAVATSGPAVLVCGNTILTGVIDPRGSGKFANRVHCRVVGGKGGWDKEVPAQDFSNPAGFLTSSEVYSVTAASVLETVIDPLPQLFGKRFPRMKGAASRVFLDRDWYVNLVTGVTFVAPWSPAVLDPSATVADFDIGNQRITVNSDNVILPGTVITNERFKGKTFIARDVEQVFDTSGTRAEIWVAEKPVSRLAEAFAVAVREFAQTAYLKHYVYRFVQPEGAALALQAVSAGAPDLNPIDQWTGLAGIQAALLGNAALAPATEIVVGFTSDNPPQPYLAAYSPLAKPLALTIDAVGPVNVGSGPVLPVALSPGVLTALTALQVEIAAIGAAVTALGGAGIPAIVKAGADAVAAAATTAPSKKLFSQ